MEAETTVRGLQGLVEGWRGAGLSVGLVPTMGALHLGHLSLVERALRENDGVVVSVFVNPTQFNNPTDLATYPRDLGADLSLLAGLCAGERLVCFAPSAEEVYPAPDERVFDLGPVADTMEGPRRPGHFQGVCKVVSKLFAYVGPDRAYFGEKDFQQVAVVRRMVEVEGFKLEIVPCPIVREADGLATSSRNVLLTPEHRAAAPDIHRALEASRSRLRQLAVEDFKRSVVEDVERNPLLKVEYFEVVDALSMQPLREWADSQQPVGCITVQAGNVRLIDNVIYRD